VRRSAGLVCRVGNTGKRDSQRLMQKARHVDLDGEGKRDAAQRESARSHVFLRNPTFPSTVQAEIAVAPVDSRRDHQQRARPATTH
jgi:hypothetical protein